MNRRFLPVAVIAFAGFFAVDALLFAGEGFLHTLGPATQEGQVLSKVARASRQAELADVIFFGSSYVRSGIAGEPFLEHGLLPFNFAVSGGAQVYEYFALKRIAQVLKDRADKPTLLLEIKTDVIPRTRNSAWSEYPQYISIVRSRMEMVQHAPALWRNFRDFDMTSQFLSGILIPSTIYRSHAVPLLGARGTLDGYFYGSEDFSGFSPLYTRAVPSMIPPGNTLGPMPIGDLYAGKIEFLRAALSLATATGCPVVLYESPTVLMGRDGRILDALVDDLHREFPAVRVIRTSDYHLEIGDFDEGGHPNIAGSDKISRYLIATLGLNGSANGLATKLARGFVAAEIPAIETWRGVDHGSVSADHALAFTPESRPAALIAESPAIPVAAGREWVLEVATPELNGRVMATLSWIDPRTKAEVSAVAVSPVDASSFGSAARLFIRARPTASQVVVRLLDYEILSGRPPTGGRIKILRLWSNQ